MSGKWVQVVPDAQPDRAERCECCHFGFPRTEDGKQHIVDGNGTIQKLSPCKEPLYTQAELTAAINEKVAEAWNDALERVWNRKCAGDGNGRFDWHLGCMDSYRAIVNAMKHHGIAVTLHPSSNASADGGQAELRGASNCICEAGYASTCPLHGDPNAIRDL